MIIRVSLVTDYGQGALVWSQICVSLVTRIGYRPRGYWAAADALYLPILNTPTVSVITQDRYLASANRRTSDTNNQRDSTQRWRR